MKHTTLFALVAMLVGCEQAATERITHFDSRITISDDGLVHVIETIRVRVAGKKIKRGIYRDVLTTEGEREFPISVTLTERDGKPIKTIVEDHSPRTRIRLIKQYGLLTHEEHEFKIRYTVQNRISMTGNRSSFKWNVTGPRWSFPIDAVRLTVGAPKDAAGLRCSAKASSGTMLKAREFKANECSFEYGQKIKPGGSLTLKMEWRKKVDNESSISE